MYLHGFGPDVGHVSLSAALPQQALNPGVKGQRAYFRSQEEQETKLRPNRYQPPVSQPSPFPSTAKTRRRRKTHLRRWVRKYSLQPHPPKPTNSQYSSPLFARFSFLPFLLHNTHQQRGGPHSRVAWLEILGFFLFVLLTCWNKCKYVCGWDFV